MNTEGVMQVKNVAIINNLGDDYFQVMWYYEKGGNQAVYKFPQTGVSATLRNIEILLARGYSVEPKETFKKLQLMQQGSSQQE